MATIRAAKAEVARTQTEARLFWREADAGSQEEEELRALVDVIESSEAKRWPSGKVAGGKG